MGQVDEAENERLVAPNVRSPQRDHNPGQESGFGVILYQAAEESDRYATVPGRPPPSYDSVFGQVRSARQDSNSCLEFVCRILEIIGGTVGCMIGIGIIIVIPMSMIVIGALYLNDCPVQHYIPIYLIVGGSFGVLQRLMSLCQQAIRQGDEYPDATDPLNLKQINYLIWLFLFAWFIAGNFWIYGIYEKHSNDPSDLQNYCHPMLFQFAFWLTNAVYIIAGLFCVFCCLCSNYCYRCTDNNLVISHSPLN